jgi:hypothetical protein
LWLALSLSIWEPEMQHDPIPTAEEATEWLYVGLLCLLICVSVGGSVAFVIENFDLIATAARDFWN